MFEKEILISGLKKMSGNLTKLVEELEQKPDLSAHDLQYYSEAIKSIESSLKKMRRMEEEAIRYGSGHPYGLIMRF